MFSVTRWRLAIGVAASLTVSLTALSASADTATETGQMANPRQTHIAVPISGGVLVAGGHPGNQVSVATAEVFNGGAWHTVASMNTARRAFGACRLPNGKVLVAGGQNDQGQGVVATAELYDPVANTWTFTGSMSTAREEFAMTCLPDGRALVTGGANGILIWATAEVYNPTSGTWSSAGLMPYATHAHRAAVLQDGRVLIAGGSNLTGTSLSSAAIWTPSTNTWASTGGMGSTRAWHALVALNDGRVLAAGGFNGFGATNTSEIWSPSTGRWTFAANMNVARYSTSAAAMTRGPVVFGGYNGVGYASAERYNIGPNTWTLTTMPNVSFDAQATPLFDSAVIVSGGNTGSTATTDTQLYAGTPVCIQ